MQSNGKENKRNAITNRNENRFRSDRVCLTKRTLFNWNRSWRFGADKVKFSNGMCPLHLSLNVCCVLCTVLIVNSFISKPVTSDTPFNDANGKLWSFEEQLVSSAHSYAFIYCYINFVRLVYQLRTIKHFFEFDWCVSVLLFEKCWAQKATVKFQLFTYFSQARSIDNDLINCWCNFCFLDKENAINAYVIKRKKKLFFS